MKFLEDKNKILIYLLICSVILLFANLLIDKYLMRGIKKSNPSISVDECNKSFESILNEFHIAESWYTKKKINKQQNDSISFVYNVRIPKDLPISLFLSEVTKKFNYSSVNINSVERKINKNTSINILFNNITILQAQLMIDTTIVRKSVSFGFIIKDIDKLSKNELNDFLKTPEEFCAVIIPSINSEYIKTKLIENQKEYAILLNDNIEDQKYKFDDKFSKQRLQSSLREILLTFTEAKLFLYDSNSDLYKSELFGYIKKEFEKRKLKLVPLNSFLSMTTSGDKEINNVLNYELSKKTDSKIFLVSAEDFNILKKEMEIQRIKGNRTVFPSSKNFGL